MRGTVRQVLRLCRRAERHHCHLLTPYPPIVYEYCEANADSYGGFLDTEPTIRKLAEKYDIPVYGSYDPSAAEGITEADFYDGLHCTGEAIEKILWARAVKMNS